MLSLDSAAAKGKSPTILETHAIAVDRSPRAQAQCRLCKHVNVAAVQYGQAAMMYHIAASPQTSRRPADCPLFGLCIKSWNFHSVLSQSTCTHTISSSWYMHGWLLSLHCIRQVSAFCPARQNPLLLVQSLHSPSNFHWRICFYTADGQHWAFSMLHSGGCAACVHNISQFVLSRLHICH